MSSFMNNCANPIANGCRIMQSKLIKNAFCRCFSNSYRVRINFGLCVMDRWSKNIFFERYVHLRGVLSHRYVNKYGIPLVPIPSICFLLKDNNLLSNQDFGSSLSWLPLVDCCQALTACCIAITTFYRQETN